MSKFYIYLITILHLSALSFADTLTWESVFASGMESEIIYSHDEKNISLGFEANFATSSFSLQDNNIEFTLPLGFSLNETLGLSIAAKSFLEPNLITYGLNIILGFTKEWENTGIEIGNDNELLFMFGANSVTFIGKLGVIKAFSINSNLSFYMAFENELNIPFLGLNNLANVLKIGPGISMGAISIYANYVLEYNGTTSHSAEVGFIFGIN